MNWPFAFSSAFVFGDGTSSGLLAALAPAPTLAAPPAFAPPAALGSVTAALPFAPAAAPAGPAGPAATAACAAASAANNNRLRTWSVFILLLLSRKRGSAPLADPHGDRNRKCRAMRLGGESTNYVLLSAQF